MNASWALVGSTIAVLHNRKAAASSTSPPQKCPIDGPDENLSGTATNGTYGVGVAAGGRHGHERGTQEDERRKGLAVVGTTRIGVLPEPAPPYQRAGPGIRDGDQGNESRSR